MRVRQAVVVVVVGGSVGCAPYEEPPLEGCPTDEQDVATVDSPTRIGATPREVIDLVEDAGSLVATLEPDSRFGPLDTHEVTLSLSLGALIEATEFDMRDDLPAIDCASGPALDLRVEATLGGDLGPGLGEITVASRGPTLEQLWVLGSVSLEQPPSWLVDAMVAPDPGARFELRFIDIHDGVPGFSTDDPASSWASPGGKVGAFEAGGEGVAYGFDSGTHAGASP